MYDISWANQPTLQSVTWDGARQRVSSPVRTALEKVLSALDGSVLTREECLALASCSGDDLFGLVVAANQLRRQLVGDVVSYVVTRNINFTNVCFVGCKFCAFSVGPRDETAYFLSLDEVAQKCREAEQWGATEVCIQGGLPRNLPPFYYRDILRAVKSLMPAENTGSIIPNPVSTSGISSKPASKLRRTVATIRVMKMKISHPRIQKKLHTSTSASTTPMAWL